MVDDGSLAVSYSRAEGIRPFFAPQANLVTGAVVGIAIQPRPRDPGMAEVVAATAATPGRAALDVGAVAGGIRRAAELGVRLPLHVDLLADTVADDGGALEALHDTVREAALNPADLTIEIGPPLGDAWDEHAVLAGARALRARGYRIGVAGVGEHDHPLALIARLAPDQVTLDPCLVVDLDTDPGGQVVLDAVTRLCRRIGAEPVATGIGSAADLEALRRHGLRIGRGPLLGDATRRPVTRLAAALPVPAPVIRPAARRSAGPSSLVEFVRPAVTLAETAPGDEARALFRTSPELGTVVLTTASQRPVATLERDRFLLGVSGRFGHALFAGRPARELADPPRVLPLGADPAEALELVREADPRRAHDDIVVVDEFGRCRGVARVADLMTAMAGLQYDRALALHPVTGLPGVPALTEALEDRLTAGQGAGIGLVTADLLPLGRGGFEAVVDGQRRVARAVLDTVPRFPGSLAAHGVGDDLVVVTDLEAPPAFDAAFRSALARRDAPAVVTAWLRHPPGVPTGAADVARELARLRAHAAGFGPGAAVSAAAGEPPRPLAG
ncbi:GGDEF domain-containing protein [Pseudonocardia ailaonensis]|uniref:GGDEF domain-containing protein n=1 Tax=Pseudonocardia ailaonensis TaxID=367279 RepID=A0ABN2NEY0_9PSEU